MLETTTTRLNPLIDPQLHVWGWEIPVYLFFGGMIAGMMVLAGANMLRVARGERPEGFFSVQTPLLAFVLINIGMVALLLDLSHKAYVWAVYLAFQPSSPMSWGSWALLLVYPVLLVSAIWRLPETWPWLAARVPAVARASEALVRRPGSLRVLGVANLALGLCVGTYTGILLATMVARPLWNNIVLGPLFLFSGLSAATAMVYLASRFVPRGPAAAGPLGGAFASLVQPLGAAAPPPEARERLVPLNAAFLAIEFAILGLLLVGLASGTANHFAAFRALTAGAFATSFWVVDVALGIVLPLALLVLHAAGRIPRTVIPALLVLAGGLSLRWILVNAGQASQFISY